MTNNRAIFFKIGTFFFITIILISSFQVFALQNKLLIERQFISQTINNSLDDSYDLLIIAPTKFTPYLQSLVDHKNKYGIKTKLIDDEEVYQQIYWTGSDDAEKIKYFIKEAYENWEIKYVLLVGGRKDQSKEETWWIPVRYSYLDRNYSTRIENKFLCDLYFADIYDSEGNFSSWDDNKNGIFGEWIENGPAVDFPDLHPDIFVGRLPCRNEYEVKTIVNKIINYETGSFSDSWFKNIVAIAGDTYPKKTDYIDGEVYTQEGLSYMSEFEHLKIWVSNGELKNWIDIVIPINRGCGFVWFSGHGGPHLWGTHPYNDSKTWIDIKLRHFTLLINRNKLPVCLSASGCFNNMFNVSLGHTDWVYSSYGVKYNIPRCWGWTLVRKSNGGSIATIASTAFSYESSDIDSGVGGCERLDIHFFEQYGENSIDILGECWGKAIDAFLDNQNINWTDPSNTGDALIVKNVEQWLLIGDPSLKIGGYN